MHFVGGPKLGDGTEIAQTDSPRWRDSIVFVSSSLLNAMKFGKKLIEQASPQWADAYLPYKSLKETIKLFQGAGPATNIDIYLHLYLYFYLYLLSFSFFSRHFIFLSC